MPKRKVLKSVARSLADSFVSLMNYHQHDYVMMHVVETARSTGESGLDVDLLTGRASPEAMLTSPIRGSLDHYCKRFPDLVRSSGAEMDFVKTARLTIDLELQPARASYTCTVAITDDQDKRYEAVLGGTW